MDKTVKDKPDIDYPCKWSYRTIGLDVNDMKSAVETLMKQKKYSYSEKNRKGKFISYELSLTVQDEAERESIFASLKDCAAFKMIL